VDAFSRVPIKPSTKGMTTKGPNNRKTKMTPSNVNSFSIEFDDTPLLEFFLNHPPMEHIYFPLDYNWIQHHQFEDEQLQQLYQLKPLEHQIMDMGNDIPLICRVCPNLPWQIAILTALLDDMVTWYHQVLGHVGIVC
jgi:hypothetical protein